MFDLSRKAQQKRFKLTAVTSGGVNVITDGERLRPRDGLQISYTYERATPADCTFVKSISHKSAVRIGGKTYQCVFDVYKRISNTYHEIYLTMFSQTDCHKIHIYQGELNPENLSCIAIESTPHFGCGVFILLSVYNRSTCQLHKIYELDYDMQSLDEITENHTTSPVLLKHGRGTLWFYANENIQKQLKDPERLQSYNCLNGRFTAKYRTDGMSREFVLPESDLTNGSIEIVMDGAEGTHNSWVIQPNSNTSNSQSVLTVVYNDLTQLIERTYTNVELKINRSYGSIKAYITGTNNPFPLPFSDHSDDNLTITACISSNATKLLMQSDEFFCIPSGDNGGKTTVLVNSQNNRMFCSTHNDPLYYPVNNSFPFTCEVSDGYSVNYCGSSTFVQLGAIIYNARSISTEKSGGVTIANTLNIIKTEGQVKRGADSSVRAVGERLYFVDRNGRICSLSTAGQSTQVKREYAVLDIGSRAVWSLEYDGKYLCCIDDEGYFANEDEPQFIFGGQFDSYQRIGLHGTLLASGGDVISLVIGGEYDEETDDDTDSLTVNARYKLCNSHCGTHSKKNFYMLRLILENSTDTPKKCLLVLSDTAGRKITRSVTADTGRTVQDIYIRMRTREITVQIDFAAPVKLCGGTLFYTV